MYPKREVLIEFIRIIASIISERRCSVYKPTGIFPLIERLIQLVDQKVCVYLTTRVVRDLIQELPRRSSTLKYKLHV